MYPLGAGYRRRMGIGALAGYDFAAGEQPTDTSDQRAFLEGWYRFQRHEFVRKLRDLSPAQLVAHSVPPVELSVLGLVRHMTLMEHVFVSWGLGGEGELTMVYGEDDYAGGSVDTVEDDVARYVAEVALADAAVAAHPSLDADGLGHGRDLSWVLVKMVDEYALHAGQAHMIRFAALGELKR